jgi:hypothetical protein
MGDIADTLNTRWVDKTETELIIEYRAKLQNLEQVTADTLTALAGIIAASNWAGVEQLLKTEALTCRNGVVAFKGQLEDHAEFIQWYQPA